MSTPPVRKAIGFAFYKGSVVKISRNGPDGLRFLAYLLSRSYLRGFEIEKLIGALHADRVGCTLSVDPGKSWSQGIWTVAKTLRIRI